MNSSESRPLGRAALTPTSQCRSRGELQVVLGLEKETARQVVAVVVFLRYGGLRLHVHGISHLQLLQGFVQTCSRVVNRGSVCVIALLLRFTPQVPADDTFASDRLI